MKILAELRPRERGKVIRVGGSKAVRRRILDMGVVPGAEVEMERIAPLGDPMEIKIKGYHLSLRREEACGIYIEVVNCKGYLCH